MRKRATIAVLFAAALASACARPALAQSSESSAVEVTAEPRSIAIDSPDSTTHFQITVTNVYDCDLEGVVLTDRIRQKDADPNFKLTAASPAPLSPAIPTDVVETADVIWELGTLTKGNSTRVTLDLQAGTSGGNLRDVAEVEATLATCTDSGSAASGEKITGRSLPVDIAILILPLTGPDSVPTSTTGAAVGMVAALSAVVVRRKRAAQKS